MNRFTDFTNKLARAITGGRLSARTHTIGNARAEAEKRGGKRPWEQVGVSRETWRRWHLPADHKNHQWPPAKRSQGKLLDFLRRSRLSSAREQQLRSGNLTIKATSRADGDRTLGPQTLGWTPAASAAVVDAFLRSGPEAAAKEFRKQLQYDPATGRGDSSGFFAKNLVHRAPDDYDDDDLAYEGDVADDGDAGDYEYAVGDVSMTGSHTGSTRPGGGGRGRS